MDKAIVIAGLKYWRTQAPEGLFGFDVDDDVARILRETDFVETEGPEKLGKKFQTCLKEFVLSFKKSAQYRIPTRRKQEVISLTFAMISMLSNVTQRGVPDMLPT